MRADRYLKPSWSQVEDQDQLWTLDTLKRHPERILQDVKEYLLDLGVEVPGDASDPDAAVSLCLTLNAACKFAGGNYPGVGWPQRRSDASTGASGIAET